MLVQDLREKILEGDLSELLHHSRDEDYPAEVGKLLGSLPEEYAINTFLALPEAIQIKIFSFLDHSLQMGIIEELPRQHISNILNSLESNDRISCSMIRTGWLPTTCWAIPSRAWRASSIPTSPPYARSGP